MKIYKYNLAASMAVPKGSKLLDIDEQGGDLMGWFLVDENEFTEQIIRFDLVGTGWGLEDKIKDRKYIKTVHLKEKGLVWHIFEVPDTN